MGWTETTARQRVGREAAAIIERRRDGLLPWDPAWQTAFADRRDLLDHLVVTWRRQQQGQDDPGLDPLARGRVRRDLAARHAGLLLVMRRHGRVVGDVA